MKLTKKTMGLTALAILASAGQSFASHIFSGATTGDFANPVGGVSVISPDGNTFNWGTSIGGNPTSQLVFAGDEFIRVPCDTPFNIGTLTYFNGTVVSGSSSTAVDLLVKITFSTPAGIVDLSYLLALNSTDNQGLPGGVPDEVSLPMIPPQAFSLAGTDYLLTVSFDGEQEFLVAEGGTDSTKLIGQIACVPESGSSLALLGGGMILISGLRRKLKVTK